MSPVETVKNASRCRCGKTIVWGTLPDGKRIPLDPQPACYTFRTPNVSDGLIMRCDRLVMVNHFATCKFANDSHKREVTDSEQKNGQETGQDVGEERRQDAGAESHRGLNA